MIKWQPESFCLNEQGERVPKFFSLSEVIYYHFYKFLPVYFQAWLRFPESEWYDAKSKIKWRVAAYCSARCKATKYD